MKVFLAILAVVSCVLAEEKVAIEAEMENVIKECSEQYPLSRKVIEEIMHSSFPTEGPIRNYMLCMVKGMALYTNYYIRLQGPEEQMKEKIINLAENCMNKYYNNHETSVAIMRNVEDCMKKGIVEENNNIEYFI